MKGQLGPPDALIAPEVRTFFDEHYYARIRRQADLSTLVSDPAFLADPAQHVALFADHGATHVRDVAGQLLHVLDAVHGVLIPARSPERLDWMRRLGVLLAYAHDIGMADAGPLGRAMHAEYVVQAALGPEFDELLALLADNDDGGIARRLPASSDTMLREFIALAMCHSKSKVPVAVLNDPPRLRQALLAAATTDLASLHRQQRAAALKDSGNPRNSPVSTRPAIAYAGFERDGFAWLLVTDAAGRELLEDAIDTTRVLRCADALRQRGTTLKTSGNNEIFADQQSANAVFALRLGGGRLYLLEIADPISAGEANLSSGELDRDGNLRIAFHHGLFRDVDTNRFAARAAALVVNDICADALGSFVRPAGDNDPALAQRIAGAAIILEAPDDNPDFAELVRTALAEINPRAAARVRIAPSLQVATAEERRRYVEGIPVDWSAAGRRAFLERVAQSGHRTDGIDIETAFEHVRRISLATGDVLVEAGGPAGFVYIPETGGLCGQPLGGYEPFAVAAWTPVGVTGVVRGAARNATIVAHAPLTLLAIPKAVYLRHWHRTYDTKAFAALFQPPLVSATS